MKILLLSKKNTLWISTVVGLFGVPALTFAQPSNFAGVVDILVDLLNWTIPVIIGLTIMYILWNAFQTIVQSDNVQKRSEGRSALIWGVIVLFVMVSVWGIINILQNTFGL